ncbi:MAG: hypothetical protein ACM3JD_18970 [Rudaea sp.]
MSKVFGPRSWIFWWAAMTATVFLQEPIRWLGNFFRDKSVFAPNIPPFSLLGGLNSWIDGVAEWLRTGIKFNPGSVLLSAGPLSVYNWMIALFIGLVILVLAALLYSRALGTSTLLDDFVALFALYFVIRIEAHLLFITNLPIISPAAKSLVGNQVVSFMILLIFLVGLTITGEGLRDARSFWRGVFEVVIVAVLLFPVEAGNLIASGLDWLLFFAAWLARSIYIATGWALIGIVLAFRRLYYADTDARRA